MLQQSHSQQYERLFIIFSFLLMNLRFVVLYIRRVHRDRRPSQPVGTIDLIYVCAFIFIPICDRFQFQFFFHFIPSSLLLLFLLNSFWRRLLLCHPHTRPNQQWRYLANILIVTACSCCWQVACRYVCLSSKYGKWECMEREREQLLLGIHVGTHKWS